MISVEIRGSEELITKLRGLTPAVRQAVNRQVIESTEAVAERARAKLADGVLHSRSGKLLESIRTSINYFSPVVVVGKVIADTPYAGIQEYGGQTKPHVILPRAGRVLRFVIGATALYAKVVHHPGSKIPARSYLRSSLEESRAGILSDIEVAVKGVL